MKIVDVKIHKLVVPMWPDAVNSPGVEDPLCAPDHFSGRVANFWAFPKWIIEMVADNGLVGLGEPPRGDIHEPLTQYAESIVGKSLPELPFANLPLPHGDTYKTYMIYEAFEMAWLDLLGKYLNVPVCWLLGGNKIDRVPVDYFMGRADPEETARRTQVAVEKGFRQIYFKCALGDPIVERVRAAREVAPDLPIVLDPNERFHNIAGAVEVSRSLEGLGPVIFESPVPQHRLDWYVLLRQKISQPIALHLAGFTPLVAALRADAADYYVLNGTINDFIQWARTAQAAGCPASRGTGLDLGVRDMSSVHAAAAVGCGMPSQIYGNFLREDDLVIDPIQYEDGCAVVPDAPGLGVELDMEAVEKYRVPV